MIMVYGDVQYGMGPRSLNGGSLISRGWDQFSGFHRELKALLCTANAGLLIIQY